MVHSLGFPVSVQKVIEASPLMSKSSLERTRKKAVSIESTASPREMYLPSHISETSAAFRVNTRTLWQNRNFTTRKMLMPLHVHVLSVNSNNLYKS